MTGELTLGAYVHRRNGVPLGARGSVVEMLRRSFGAGSFAAFWRHWNPVFGYYLGRFVFVPLRRFLPRSLAVVLTFTASGLIHDGVMWVFGSTTRFLFTPWFTLMALGVVIGRPLGVEYSDHPWPTRALINFGLVAGCLGITLAARHFLTIP